MLALYETLVAVTSAPLCVTVAFQALPTLVSPGKVNVSRQPLIAAVPVLAIVTLATMPPCHSLVFAYDTRQAPVGVGEEVVDVGVGVGVVVRVGVAVGVRVGVGVDPLPGWSCTTTMEYAGTVCVPALPVAAETIEVPFLRYCKTVGVAAAGVKPLYDKETVVSLFGSLLMSMTSRSPLARLTAWAESSDVDAVA